jgi:LPS-assembly lipoprotein
VPKRWGQGIAVPKQLVRVAFVVGLGALNAACFQPVYGNQPLAAGNSVRDKLAAVDVAQIPAANGHPESRLAVELRNELLSEFNNGAVPGAPLYRLQVNGINSGIQTVIVDVASGRPDTQMSAVNVSYSLVEIATGKVVLNSSTFGRASFDIPGSAQRFAQQRAWLNAEDRAVSMIADNIRNRLASFFVAGT